MPQPSARTPEPDADKLPGAEIGVISLRFSSKFWERLYHRQQYRNRRPQTQIWAFFGFAFFALAGLLEWMILPEKLGLALFVRFGVCLPLVSLNHWLGFYSRYQRSFARTRVLTHLVTELGAAFMYTQVPPAYRDLYLYQYLIVLLYMYQHMGAEYRVAALAGNLSTLCFMIPALLRDGIIWHSKEMGQVALLLLANAICTFNAYNHELALRRNFRARYLVARRQKTERDLQERLSAASRLEAIGRLAGGVAHDFNNLLQIIAGSVEFALGTLEDPRLVSENLRLMGRTAQSGGELTRQLLAFSRQQETTMSRIDLPALVELQARMLRRIIPSNIEVEIHLDTHGAEVLGDPGMLEQVLLNLCINARDAMPAGGKLSISSAIEVATEEFRRTRPWAKADRYVVLSVADTGEGVPPEVQQRIFEPFFTTKEFGKGTGLGLSIVYGIVQQHEGMVELQSRLGAGTTFRVYLPCVPPDGSAAAPQEEAAAATRGQGETLLLVEDNADLRMVLIQALQQAGYRVLGASDGEAGLGVFMDHRASIRLAILDVMLPKIGGYALCKRMRAVDGALPVIFSSGYTGTPVGIPPAGMESVPTLRKPYQIEALRRLVRELLDRAGA